MKKRLLALLLAPLLATTLLLAPTRSFALDRDVRSVIVAGAYGMGGGTLLGLAAFPITQNPRSIFLGTSLGLYLGLAVGLYYVWNRYDPYNPIGPYAPESEEGEDRPDDDYYPEESWRRENGVSPIAAVPAPIVDFRLVVLRF